MGQGEWAELQPGALSGVTFAAGAAPCLPGTRHQERLPLPPLWVCCCQVHGENTLLDLKQRIRPTGWVLRYLGLFQVNPCCVPAATLLAGRHGRGCRQQGLPSRLPPCTASPLLTPSRRPGQVTSCWRRTEEQDGFKRCRFELVREAGQAPLPRNANGSHLQVGGRRACMNRGQGFRRKAVLSPTASQPRMADGLQHGHVVAAPAHCCCSLTHAPVSLQLYHSRKGRGSTRFDLARLELTAKWLERCWDCSDLPEICT